MRAVAAREVVLPADRVARARGGRRELGDRALEVRARGGIGEPGQEVHRDPEPLVEQVVALVGERGDHRVGERGVDPAEHVIGGRRVDEALVDQVLDAPGDPGQAAAQRRAGPLVGERVDELREPLVEALELRVVAGEPVVVGVEQRDAALAVEQAARRGALGEAAHRVVDAEQQRVEGARWRRGHGVGEG